MASKFVSPLAGLHVAASVYGLPEGALQQADNVVMRSKGIIESRRGHADATYAFSPTATHLANVVQFYDEGHVVQFTGTADAQKLAYSSATSYSTHSAEYIPPSTALRMKFAEMSSNLYFNTSLGAYVKTGLATTPTAAGLRRVPDIKTPQGFGGFSTSLTSGTGAFLPQNSQVAYRITTIIKDANGNLKESPPSGRFVVTNPAAVAVTAANLVRSANTAGATATATVISHGFRLDDTVTLAAGDANFPAGSKTITAVTATTIQWVEPAGSVGTTCSSDQTLSTGTKYVTVVALLPTDSTTAHSIRLYRSLVTSAATISPSDELYQIYEARLTSNGRHARAINDTTPESSLYSTPLYTNPKTGDGALSSNFQPPISKDLCVWKERLWFANTVSRHSYVVQLLGVGTPDGMQTNDTVTVGGETYTGNTAYAGAAYGFKIHATSLSAANNIRDTAQALCYIINNTSTTTRAFYISGETDAPGRIQIEEDAIGGSTFYFSASRPASWSPVPPATIAVTEASSSRAADVVTITAVAHGFTTGDSIYLAANAPHADFPGGVKGPITVAGADTFTYAETGANSATIPTGVYYVHALTQASVNDAAVNKVFYSKFQQPEAVPLTNYVTVGAKNKEILRIFPSRDKLLVFKEDAIYIISGDPSGGLRVDLLDPTARLLAPDSVAAANNQVYCLTNQGVVTVSDVGVGLVSRPIESYFTSDFQAYLRDPSPTVVAAAKAGPWACAYDSERQYILGVGGANGQTDVLVYNILTSAWTMWPDLSYRFGAVDPETDKLYFAPNYLYNSDGQLLSLNYNVQFGAEFIVGETITGGTSGATATVYNVSDFGTIGTLQLVDATGVFVSGETITGGTSGGTAGVNGTPTLSPTSVGLSSNKLKIERKANTAADYADGLYTVYVTSVVGNVATLNPTFAGGISVGDYLGGQVVTATNSATRAPFSSTPITATTAAPVVGAAELYRAIPCAVEFAPNAFETPSAYKQFSETHLHFQRLNAYTVTAKARTEASATATESILHPAGFVANTNTLTALAPAIQNQRLLIPVEKQRGTTLRYGLGVREAFALWQLVGFSVEVEGGSTRSQR